MLNWFKLSLVFVALFSCSPRLSAQNLDSLVQRIPFNSDSSKMNMDAVYNRPFLTVAKSPVALGGYVEANSIYSSTDGVSEGLSFQARRLTIFMSASISNRIKFLSEMEFEDGVKEIGIEFAAIDVSLHPLFNLRGGIVMNPIGSFNQNHDGPKWEFVERPTSGVNLLPATWSNVGFGAFGKAYFGKWVLGYEAYLTNGFDESIIDNELNRTYLPAAKDNPDRFEESFNGTPLYSGKLALKRRGIGELGFSYMGGIYNQFETEALVLTAPLRLDVFSVDIATSIAATRTTLVGEYVRIGVETPATYTQQYGSKQEGAYLDIIQTLWQGSVLGWEKATLNFALRGDYVDWNIGRFSQNNEVIGDQLWAITPAVSFRPSAQTVFRLNYRYEQSFDILGNGPAKTGSILFGFSSYF